VQDAITANTGEQASRAAGAYFQSSADRARAPVAASDKHKLVKLTPEQYESWRKKVAVVRENWANERTDGQKTIDAYEKFYNEAKGGR
jgi:ribosomal protein L19E